jgi:hypothetical protein
MRPASWIVFVAGLPLLVLVTVPAAFQTALPVLALFLVLGWLLLWLSCEAAGSVVRIGEALHNVPHIGSARSPEVRPCKRDWPSRPPWLRPRIPPSADLYTSLRLATS